MVMGMLFLLLLQAGGVFRVWKGRWASGRAQKTTDDVGLRTAMMAVDGKKAGKRWKAIVMGMLLLLLVQAGGAVRVRKGRWAGGRAGGCRKQQMMSDC